MTGPLFPIPSLASGPPDPAEFTRLLQQGGHTAFLGMTFHDSGPDWVELSMAWREDLVGDPETGVFASGPIISLLDNATAIAVWMRRGGFVPHVTLDLRIDYLRAAQRDRAIVARAECYQVRRSMAFVRGLTHDGDPADPVAHVSGIFMLVEAEAWGLGSGDTA